MTVERQKTTQLAIGALNEVDHDPNDNTIYHAIRGLDSLQFEPAFIKAYSQFLRDGDPGHKPVSEEHARNILIEKMHLSK